MTILHEISLDFLGLTNKCKKSNGGCEDICQLNAAGSVVCSCHAGRSLLKDGRRCVTRETPFNCSETEFQCSSSGICIPFDWTCDLQLQCDDGSDEDPIFCGKLIFAIGDEDQITVFTMLSISLVQINNTRFINV